MAAASIILPRKLSEKYLRDGKELLKEGDHVQASEKLWGAAALTVKMVAAKRGLKLEEHGGLWVFINLLAKESGDKDCNKFFGEANALHRNFYENEMEKESGVMYFNEDGFELEFNVKKTKEAYYGHIESINSFVEKFFLHADFIGRLIFRADLQIMYI